VNLRTKLVLALVASASAATVFIGAYSYVATANRLDAELDRSIVEAVQRASAPQGDHDGGRGGRPGPSGDAVLGSYGEVVVQLVESDGTVVVSPNATVTLPVDPADLALARAAGASAGRWRTVTVDGEDHRVVTVALGGGQGAIQAGRSLAESQRLLDSLRTRTLVAVLAVVVASAVLAWLIARQVTRRLVRLTGVAEHVAATGELDVPVPTSTADEVGRLGVAFNEMLGALARSKEDQQRLVQDAGHELRTPLTSLRTNISVMRRFDELPPDSRALLLDDLDGETRELTRLINEVVELATDRRGDEPAAAVDLGRLVQRVADRVQRRTGRAIVVDADDTVVIGRPLALERAVVNLLDNACKFDDSADQPIEASVRAGRVEVCDHGRGIDPTDLAHLFDRFYRSVTARSRPGSGLGLAIVRDVVTGHGGTVFASNRPGGGACIGFQLPVE